MDQDELSSAVPLIEGIQTANKNIYSYFMKSEHSYYVPQEQRYPLYKKDTDTTYIVVITEYTSSTPGDYTYKTNTSSIETVCLIGKNPSSLTIKKIDLSLLGNTIKDLSIQSLDEPVDIKECFIGLVYPDGLNRVSLMNITDTLLTQCKFKGLLLSPFSLGVSLGLSLSNSLVISQVNKIVAAIEDNCVFDSVVLGMKGTTSLYGYDIADELLHKEEIEPEEEYLNRCYLCNALFSLSEFTIHFKNKHQLEMYSKSPTERDTLLSKCKVELSSSITAPPIPSPTTLKEIVSLVVERISPAERQKKVLSSLIYITENKTLLPNKEISEEEKELNDLINTENTTITHLTKEESNTTAWKGLYALTNIEPSKDLWLTDKEWNSVGLRVLKEKVLFPV